MGVFFVFVCANRFLLILDKCMIDDLYKFKE